MSRRRQLFQLARRSLAALIEWVLSLEAQLRQLQRYVKQLEARLAQNSQNSHKPPSTDGPAKPKSLRQKSRRKPGGQPGHPGRTLQPVADPDDIVPHCLDRCPCGQCRGGSLREQPVYDYAKRQVFDLPTQWLQVTEHRAEIKICPVSGLLVQAEFPREVRAPAQYGPRFKSVLTYLNVEHFIPYDRLGRLVEDIFGQPISEATVVSSNQRIYEKLQPFEKELAEQLVGEALVHADESGVRVGGKGHWLHVACTERLTFYGIHPSRGSKAMDQFDIIPRLRGWLMHDHLNSYLLYKECLHTFCNEHHLRELKFQSEQNGQAWAEELSQFLLRQKQWREEHGLPGQWKFKKILAEYHSILAKGRKRHPRKQGPGAQSKAANLLDRLEYFDLNVLAFLIDLKVPFTNNQAEQDIRMVKLRQKISGGFRTLDGARVFARIRSYISTSRKQGRNILDALERSYRGDPFMPNCPAAAP